MVSKTIRKALSLSLAIAFVSAFLIQCSTHSHCVAYQDVSVPDPNHLSQTIIEHRCIGYECDPGYKEVVQAGKKVCVKE